LARLEGTVSKERVQEWTCVGWQIALLDPIWQVTLHSSVMGFA